MNTSFTRPFRILIADDDSDDIQLTKDCFVENRLPVHVHDVGDGQILIDHLKTMTDVSNLRNLPQLIILDLNMPRKSGLEALE